MHKFFEERTAEEYGHWRASGLTVDCGIGFSVYCGGATGNDVTDAMHA
jgi:hypothetical protein